MTTERAISIPIDSRAAIVGDLVTPGDSAALVIFAHGSGSSRLSPRNRAVADVLHRARLATLLIDLLVEEEDTDQAGSQQPRFDIEMLSRRLAQATSWCADEPELAALPFGYFGASTGAAAALAAAAREPERIGAVVSRG